MVVVGAAITAVMQNSRGGRDPYYVKLATAMVTATSTSP